MATIMNIGRIDCSSADAPGLIRDLRRQLSPRGDVVSPEGRARTIAAFGEPLTPEQVVARICDDVRDRGLAAVLDYTSRLDRVDLAPAEVRVSPEELREAHASADPAYLRTIRRVRDNILAFQSGILHRDATFRRGKGCELRLRYRPLRRVGVCIPGGAAAYPSSLLMTVVPAQAAGVEQIAVVVPPTPFGGYNTDLLAACHALGVTEVHRVGGAQAVAGLAYGVEGIESVDKIVGPIDRVAEALDDQLARLSRGDLARDSLERFGALILVKDEDEAVTLTNQIAPEHLHVSTADPDRLAERLTNAGAIFLGHETPVAVGDYAAGPSHVLPTGGTARWASGLSSNDFLKKTSLIWVDRDGLRALAPDIRMLADKEGLSAHRSSVDIRLEEPEGQA